MAKKMILKVRVEALRANLEKIKSHLEKMPDPRKEFLKVEEQISGIRNALLTVRSAVSDSIIWTEDGQTSNVPNALSKAEQALKETTANLKNVSTQLESIRKRYQRIQETDLGKGIVKELSDKTDPCIQVLDNVEAGLEKLGPEKIAKRWADFSSQAGHVNEDIFAQYIEFIGGLALRDAGFDEGISRVANELLRSCCTKKNSDVLLAIPTRQRAVAMTMARIIRVTFPDWTIWALPSTALEFWHVITKRDVTDALNRALRNITGNEGDTAETRFDDCLGDAFATYTMGPAYALFAIYLLLKPNWPFTPNRDDTVDRVRAKNVFETFRNMTSAELGNLPCEEVRQELIKAWDVVVDVSRSEERAADHVRAHAIFEMLRLMNSKDPGVGPYDEIRDELVKVWDDAISQTGAKPSISETEKIGAEKMRVSQLIQALWDVLVDGTIPPFTSEVWLEIRNWVDPILKNKVEEIKVPQGAELRHVMNAAWLARINPNRDPKVDITAAANELRKRIPTLTPI
jgi:hypothetical protein